MGIPQRKILAALLKYIPLGLCLVCILLFLLTRRDLSVQTILSYTPESSLLAAGMMLLLYAGKSMSIFFPMMVLQIVGGHLFSIPVALLVNTVGMFIILTLPYFVGYFSGTELVGKLSKKYPKLNEIIENQNKDSFFISFFVRVISILPGDIVSMYFGASGMPFWVYLWGSALGTIPGVITSTIIGSSLEDPTSSVFIGSLLLTVALSVLSLLLHYFHQKNKNKKKEDCIS